MDTMSPLLEQVGLLTTVAVSRGGQRFHHDDAAAARVRAR